MAANGPRVEVYCYSEAATAGEVAPDLDANGGMAVIEQGTPGTTTYGRPTDHVIFSTQLISIRTEFDASAPAGLYTMGYAADTQRVPIASTNATTFRPQMPANAATWFGFTQDLSAAAGWALSWTADDAPAGIVDLVAVEAAPAEDAARVDMQKYRHGRAVSTIWGNRQVHQVKLTFRRENLAQIAAGYLTTGRVRIWQAGDGTAYSPTNVDGYIDGRVVATTDITEDGDVGELWTIGLVVGVAR